MRLSFLTLGLVISIIPAAAFAAADAPNEISEPISIYFEKGILPMVDCTFDGNLAKNGCLFDTGFAAEAVVPPSLNGPAAYFHKSDKRADTFMTLTNVDGCDLRDQLEVKFGPFTSPLNQALRCDQNGFAWGIVGLRSLGNNTWKFDRQLNQLTPQHQISDESKASPFKRDAVDHIVIAVTIAGKDIQTVFDTGAPLTFVDVSVYNENKSNFSFIKSVPFKGVPVPVDLYQVTGFLTNGKPLLEPGLVGVFDFSKVPLFQKARRDGLKILLGENAMKDHVWEFDLAKNIWEMN